MTIANDWDVKPQFKQTKPKHFIGFESHGHHVLEVLHLEEFTPGPVNIQGYRLQCLKPLKILIVLRAFVLNFCLKKF